jgi:putative NADPH-quinone reductase
MKQLVIVAHPKKTSLNTALKNAFVQASKKAKHQIECIDLYDHKNEITYLSLNNKQSKKEKEFIQKCQEKIKEADELIFFFPMWNYAEPAILKNWYDSVFTPGFAFKYTGKLLPEKLLTGKTAQFFVTCDGPSWYYKLIGDPLKKIWKSGRMEFSGIKVKRFKYIDKVRLMNQEECKKCLAKISSYTK